MTRTDARGAITVCHFCSTALESKYFNTLGKGLALRGVTVHGASLTTPEPPSWLTSAGGDYLFLNAGSRARYPWAAIRLARWLRARRVDILQTHLFEAGMVGVLAARLARVPLVVTRHHSDFMFLAGTRAHVFADRLTARFADRVVVLSEAVRNHMVRREGVEADKIDVIHQGFDFEGLCGSGEDGRRVRAEFGMDDAFVVGVVASFFRGKGHRYLFDAAGDLLRDIPRLKLFLVGTGDRRELDALIRERGLEDRVIFAGFRHDTPACFRAMDVVVHPSLTEAFCQVIVEALAAERPLVATDVGAASEVVVTGEHALLVPAGDAGAIAAAVRRIHGDPAFGRAMAQAGHRRVLGRFTIDRMVTAQVECYRRWVSAIPPARLEGPDVAIG